MAMLSIGLVVGAVVGAFVAGGSLDRGFPFEVAVVRGVVAFMALAFVGYLGELVVVTAPQRERAADRPTSDEDAEAPPETSGRAVAPRLVAAARPADEDNNNADDDDADLRSAA